METTQLRNWSGNYAYRHMQLHRPTSLDELRAIVARTSKIHALGSRHCFNDIADAAELITTEGLGLEIELDRAAHTVTINPFMRYGDLARALQAEGFALHNMASLPHISVGGAVATATHGSGDKLRNLSSAMTALDLVTADGSLIHLTRDDPEFAGAVVGIGALGVIIRLTLEIQPSYRICQTIYEHLPWDVLYSRFDAVMGGADSVSLFIDYGEDVGQIWHKTRVDPDVAWTHPADILGAAAATVMVHPVPGVSTENLTDQLGTPGLWLDRLPHFRLEAIPASGAEYQTEYMVARSVAVDAIRAVREVSPVFRPHLLTSEIRTVAADDFWLSSAYGADTVCLHFSWRQDMDAVMGFLPALEDALAPFSPRPHWGKIFVTPAEVLAPRYPKMAEFRQLAAQLDPTGKFRNAFLDRHVFG